MIAQTVTIDATPSKLDNFHSESVSYQIRIIIQTKPNIRQVNIPNVATLIADRAHVRSSSRLLSVVIMRGILLAFVRDFQNFNDVAD
jgi:hypothetical protein